MKSWIKKPWIKILIGLVLGVTIGLIVGKDIEIFNVAGKIFIDLLRMLVGLIIFSSLVVGICHINDPKKLGRIGLTTFAFYAITTIIAIAVGLVFAFVIKPGVGLNLKHSLGINFTEPTLMSWSDFILSLVPKNPFTSFTEGNVLQIIVFAVLFALGITISGERGKPVLSFLESVAEIMYSLAHLIMRLAPIGVFALMASAIGSTGIRLIYPLAKFLACNYLACLIQIVVIFSLILRYAKLEISPFFKGMKDAIVVAFSTSSSSATLPVSLECARDHLGVSKDVAGFVMSLGSTVNMNGAAIGQAISAVFIAQAYGIPLSALKIITLFVISLVSAIGAAGVPGTGLIMLSVVLNAMGLPLEGIALLAGVDRIREMISSVVNVLGDAAAAVFIAKREKQIDEDQYHHTTWLE
ncbi:MAG: dicarboxylate/amino acid:cation symporter [Chlamydiales bacterium]